MKINVVSFNIRCGNDPDGNSIPERAPRLKKILSDYDADIIGFQEYTPLWEPFITEYYGEDYEIFNMYRAEKERESAPMLWKKKSFQCIKRGYFWLSDTPEVSSKGWDELFDCYRICMWAVLKHRETGKTFCYMNTHFGFGDDGQIKSVELINKYRKEISDFPTFITGDFNMTPSMPAYKRMTEYFTDVNAVTAKDMRTTYHGYHKKEVDEHIDYCFVDDSIIPISYEMIETAVDGKYPSDHYGIISVIDIK
ncbi:MAG: endonuclease/exonuclease/phosphatase family protein [Clostridia bacterium]|nr:endonuclease/exonuclease/phosphatase family protein [Clostridia bacterium]